MDVAWTDPAELPLDQLRAERARLSEFEDVVSYVRRLAQGRLDLVRAELHRRVDGDGTERPFGDPSGELPRILSGGVAAGSGRPPRDVEVSSDHPLVRELDEICEAHGYSRLTERTEDELRALVEAISSWEQSRSHERHELFVQIDALTAELVRRYREGAASVDSLLGDG
jgi:hypothetical protein